MRLRRITLMALVAAVLGTVAAVVTARLRTVTSEPPPDLSGSPAAGLQTVLRRRTPANGNARVLGPAGEPATLQAFASWVPPAPRNTATRAAAYAWASPLTLVGLLLGAASGARPEARDGVMLFAGVRGPVASLLKARGFTAMTLGHAVISRVQPSPTLMAHELVHVRQAERLGPVFAPLYGLLYLAYGYTRHPMERAARLGGRRDSHDGEA